MSTSNTNKATAEVSAAKLTASAPTIRLSQADQEKVAAIVIDAPTSNEAMKRAFIAHSELIRKS